MFKYFKNIITPMLLVLLTPVLSLAAEGAAESGEKINVMLIGLVSMVLVLLFAILILGNTLRQLSFVYREKMREKRSDASTGTKALLVLLGASLLSSSVIAQEATSAAAVSPYINGMLKTEFYTLATIIILELLIIVSLIFMIKTMVRVISKKPELAATAQKIVKKVPFWDKFNAAVAIEKEEDILLDHDYDGIQELDNSLPPWWKYGFYLTIVVGVIYLWYYHAGSGLNQEQEYVQSVERANKEIAKYLANAADNVDENSVVMLDAAGIAAGADMFSTTCAACHATDGGGNSIGPNLTDKYWLHGGSLKDIFKSIKYGWKDKGMQSWQNTYSPKQIAQIASYVKSLQGTTPAAPKDPQGELYEEEVPAADSTSEVATVVE